jgi:hypothetical protein
MTKTYKITGSDAVRLAQRENLTIRCHANPIDPEDREVTATEAKGIIREDARLIYVTVVPTGWRDSRGNHCDSGGRAVESYFNAYTGQYLGPDDDGVEPCWNQAL